MYRVASCILWMFVHSVVSDQLEIVILFAGAKVVLLYCLFLHISILNADYFVLQAMTNVFAAFICFVQGDTLLFYPLVEYLTDTCFTRYKIFSVSICLLLASSVLVTSLLALMLILSEIDTEFVFPIPWYYLAVVAVLLSLLLLSLGVFLSTAIQFGMDQMMEASSDQISA